MGLGIMYGNYFSLVLLKTIKIVLCTQKLNSKLFTLVNKHLCIHQQTQKHIRKALLTHLSVTTVQRNVCVTVRSARCNKLSAVVLFIQIYKKLRFALSYFVFLYYSYLSTGPYLRTVHTAYFVHSFSELAFIGKYHNSLFFRLC